MVNLSDWLPKPAGKFGQVCAGADGHLYAGKDWGEAPTRVEGIPARSTLPFAAQAVQVWALDECGQRKTSFGLEADAKGQAVVASGPERQTIWYEVMAK